MFERLNIHVVSVNCALLITSVINLLMRSGNETKKSSDLISMCDKIDLFEIVSIIYENCSEIEIHGVQESASYPLP